MLNELKLIIIYDWLTSHVRLALENCLKKIKHSNLGPTYIKNIYKCVIR